MSERQDELKQQAFLQQTRVALDAAEQQIDAATQTGLRAVRREALAAADRPRLPPWLVPASGLAVAATVATLTVSLWQLPPADADLVALEDIVLLSDEVEPEFYAELAFYAWIAEGAPAADVSVEGDRNGAG